MPRLTRSKTLIAVGLALVVGGWCIPEFRTGDVRFDSYERLRAVLYICGSLALLLAWWLRPQSAIDAPEAQLQAKIRFWLPLPIALYLMLTLPLVVGGAGRYGGGAMVVGAIFELGLILNLIYRFRLKRELQRRPDGLCHRCDYCLRGNVTGICPECGTKVPVGMDV